MFRHRLDPSVTWKIGGCFKLCEGAPFFPRGLEVMEHIHILHLFCRNVGILLKCWKRKRNVCHFSKIAANIINISFIMCCKKLETCVLLFPEH